MIDGNFDWDEDGVIDHHESVDKTSAILQEDYFSEMRFDQFGEVNKAAYQYVTGEYDITSTQITFDGSEASSGASGGISHHLLRDGSRIRFSFAPGSHGSSVGIVALDEAVPGVPAPIRAELDESGATPMISVITDQGFFSFPALQEENYYSFTG